MAITNREWAALAASCNLDPETGRKLTPEELAQYEPISKWELDERLGRHKKSEPIKKPHDETLFWLALIFTVSIGTYLYWVL